MITPNVRSSCARVAPLVVAVIAGACPTAQATLFSYTAVLNGPSESPPNNSPGTGSAQVDYDDIAHTMRVRVTFMDLTSGTTASHIHSATSVPGMGTAMVATQTPTFVNFPLGVMSGTYDNMFDMTLASSYNPAFVTAHGGTTAMAEAFLAQSLAGGTAYLNIHTTNFTGGEIRGFLLPIPAPSTGVVLGLVGLGAMRRRRT